MALTDRESTLVNALDDAQDSMEALLERLVGINSYSTHAAGANAVADLVEAELEALGFRTAVLVSGNAGRSVVARRVCEGSHRLLLLGHGDTVHPPESPFQAYTRVDDNRATGPGAADMKGGLVVMLFALRAMKDAGLLDDRHVTVVMNADEEVGSPDSADLIRGESAESHLCLCYEAGRPRADGSSTFVTSRRGFGRMRFLASGRAAHAGVDPGAGASAVLELCHKAIALNELADPEAGVLVNVGVLRGGTAANTVAASAELLLDYRFPDEDQQLDLEDRIFNVAAKNILRDADGRPLVATVMRDQVKRGAMIKDEAIGRMSDRLVAWGSDLGLDLVEEARGGSSDAALATEMGCPAVCGLGVVGDQFHTDDEWILRKSLVDRAKLSALTMARFFEL